MEFRELRASDLPACLAIEPRVIGDALTGREAALRVWRQWIASPAFQSAVVEAPWPGGNAASGARIAAFGASIFVQPEFAAREWQNPRPGLNSRILASEAAGNTVLRSALADAGHSCPLDVVILACNCCYPALTPAEAAEAEVLLPLAFAEAHLGYRIGRILIETHSQRQRQVHLSSGVWRAVKVYPGGSALLVLSAQEAFAVSGSIAAPLFHYQPPVLSLREADKQLLAAAIHGDTDAALAARLGLTLSAVKKRWAALFDRVAETHPELLPEAGEGPSASARGPQKRHRILCYVRTHPQELRPFRWSRQGSDAASAPLATASRSPRSERPAGAAQGTKGEPKEPPARLRQPAPRIIRKRPAANW